jgi:small subunit ribosomal protein S1
MAHDDEAWERIASAFEHAAVLVAVVTGVTEGGLAVDVGRPGFLPEDQIDLLPVRDLFALVGRELEVRVVRFDVRRQDLVVSRRVVLEERRDALAGDTRSKLHVGAVLTGRVKTLTDYAAFVDLGGVTGMIHAADLGEPSDVLAIGDEVVVSVLRCSPGGPIFLALQGGR